MSNEKIKDLKVKNKFKRDVKGRAAAIGLAVGLGATSLAAGCTPEDIEALEQYGIEVEVPTEDPTVEPTVEPTEVPTEDPVEEEEFELTVENIIAHAPAKIEVNLAEGEAYVPKQATKDEVYAKIDEIKEYTEQLYNAEENEEIRNKYNYDAVRDLHILRLLYLNTETIDAETCQEVIDTYLQEMPILNSTLSDIDFYGDFKQSKNSMFYLDEVYANEFEILEYYYDMNDKCKEQYGADYSELEEAVLLDSFDNEKGYFTLDIIDNCPNEFIYDIMRISLIRDLKFTDELEEHFDEAYGKALDSGNVYCEYRLYLYNWVYGKEFGYQSDFIRYNSSYTETENKTI